MAFAFRACNPQPGGGTVPFHCRRGGRDEHEQYGWDLSRLARRLCAMKVRLLRKFAESIDGIDLSFARKGDLIDVSSHDARILIVEGWAEPVAERDRADDQPQPKRRTKKK